MLFLGPLARRIVGIGDGATVDLRVLAD
jgi:hypothetical protein